MNLRDALLSSLKDVPGTRQFHLHVLVTTPRKYSTLFPFATPRPKTYAQDVLILLSAQPNPESPRMMVTGIEASVYTIPSTSSAILYVSKVDSTGQSISPSPTTTLVRALLTFYGSPATRPLAVEHLWIHLFARAQGQYLFPNSTDYAGKRPLSDTQLCSWWKRLLTDVAKDIAERSSPLPNTKLYYLLPGYSELEAINLLKQHTAVSTTAANSHSWIYGHPYSQKDVPLPCPTTPRPNLGHFIPYFEDDPKSRFLDEIGCTTEADGVKSPMKKRHRADSGGAGGGGDGGDVATVDKPEKDSRERKESRPKGELGIVSADDFWERMSFRQECVAGAVTGFFTVVISTSDAKDSRRVSSSSTADASSYSPMAPQAGQVSQQINKRILASLLTAVEFSTVERAIRATETLESAIKGLCEGLSVGVPPDTPIQRYIQPIGDNNDIASASLLTIDVPQHAGTAANIPAVAVPPDGPVMSTSLETYHSHIYGSVLVSNPLPAAVSDRVGESKIVDAPVTMLAVRRKKRPQPS